jgi:RNA polymerase sigma-70 factor, ECF subfamily
VSGSIDRGPARSEHETTTAPEDDDSGDVLSALRGTGEAREEAVARLRALLLHAARFEVARRRTSLPRLRADELDDIALAATAEALVEVLGRLDDCQEDRRFSTWVYKFAVRETASRCVARPG